MMAGSKGARVVVSPGRAAQQKLLGGRGDFGGLGRSLRGIDDFFDGGVEIGILGAVSGRGVGSARDRVVGG